MQSPNIIKKIISVMLVLTVVFAGCISCEFAVGAKSYKEQISDLEKKQADAKAKISSLNNDISKQEELKKALQEQIDAVQEQIDTYNSKISEIEQKISEIESKKADKEAELESSKQSFLSRLRAMYISGDSSGLSILLTADDFGQYLYQDQLLASVTKYDNETMEKLKNDIEEIANLEKQAEAEKTEVEAIKSTVTSKQAELGNSMKQLNSVIGGLQSDKADLEDDLKEYAASVDALEEKIKAEASKSSGSSGGSSSGGSGNAGNIKYNGQFTWPVPGYFYISSNFGPRWGRTHKGVDIAGSNIYGKPIVAAASGVVSYVGYDAAGYGYYVMINHGNKDGKNYITLYGHMSRTAASTGQTVSAGQTIGYVGSTGRSTGPHCHFEIRVNGTAQNPLSFF